jgi:hypothetical protein
MNNTMNNQKQPSQPQVSQNQMQPNQPQVNPLQQIQSQKGSKNNVMIACIVLFFVIISGIFGAVIGTKFFSTNEESQQPEDNTDGNGEETPPEENNRDGNGEEEPEDKIIVVTSPANKEEINGRVLVEGQASRVFEELTVRLYDDDLNLLGQAFAGLTTGQDVPIREWSTFLDITKSPTTLVGRIKIFPSGENETSKYAKSVGVKFEQTIVPGRLQVFTPIRLQLMQGETVSFRGNMKNFYENTMGVRLMSEKGKEILDDEITAKANTKDKFVTFEKIVDLRKNLDNYGINGTWEFFEIDKEGEPGNVILSLSVRFE